MRLETVLILLLLRNYAVSMDNYETVRELCTFVIKDKNFEDFSISLDLRGKIQFCSTPSGGGEVTLRVENCTLPAFPDKVFSQLPSLQRFTLKLSNKTSVQLLAPDIPSYQPFANLKLGSAIIEINDADTMAGWRWDVLSNIQVASPHGLQFIAFDTKLVYLHKDFGKIARGNVTVVRFVRCQLRWLGKSVFAPFNSLQMLELRDNKIEYIERSHLPTKAPKFRTIDLGKNRLTAIPEDLFSHFEFSTIYLDGNNILVPMEIVRIIMTVKHFKPDPDFIWPCNCDVISGLKARFGDIISKNLCLKADVTMLVATFQASCRRAHNENPLQ